MSPGATVGEDDARSVGEGRTRPTKLLAQKLGAYCKTIGKDDVRIEAYLDAGDEFRETGRLPQEKDMGDAVLWDVEMTSYLRMWGRGEDSRHIIAALLRFWDAPARDRAAALAEVEAAVVAGPERADSGWIGSDASIGKSLRCLAVQAASAKPIEGPREDATSRHAAWE